MDQSGLFEGSQAKYLSYDVTSLTARRYRLAGQLVALSIRYDGPGPQCLHPAVYNTICGQDVTDDLLDIEQLQDGEMKALLVEVRDQCMVEMIFCTLRWCAEVADPACNDGDDDIVYL